MAAPAGETVLCPQTRWQRAAPIMTLLVLTPVIAEVLFGSTRISTMFVLIPQIGTWGCAALIIREVGRRRGGCRTILLLGVALALLEECVIQQTSLAPLVGVDPQHAYGRTIRVNWIYLLWAVGYESVWAVVLPIGLVELIFPGRREAPWVGKRGFIIAGTVFVFASFIAWYSWTQMFVPQYFPELAHQVKISAVMIALVIVAALIAAAVGLRPCQRFERPTNKSTVPGSWLVGLGAFVLALPWFGLVLLAYGAWPAFPPVVAFGGGLLLAGASFLLIRYWSSSSDWKDAHRLALILGALAASMSGGFVIMMVGRALLIDRIAQLVFNGIAFLLLTCLARKVRHRQLELE